MAGKVNQDLIQVDAGPAGAAGADGATLNTKTIEGILTWTNGTPFYTVAYTYPVSKGSVWVATGSWSYVDDSSYMEVVLTGFMLTSIRKFTATIQTYDIRKAGAVALVSNSRLYYSMEIIEKSDNKIRFRVVRGGTGYPVAVDNIPFLTGFESLTFAIHITAAD